MPNSEGKMGGAVWIGVGVSASVVTLFLFVALVAFRRFRYKMKTNHFEGVRLVVTKSPYDASQQVSVPAQVDTRKDSISDGMLAVLESTRRAKSFECLPQEVESTVVNLTPLCTVRKYSSTTSLDTLSIDNDLPHEDSKLYFSLKRCPYVEFTLLWASTNSTLTVYVLRLTSLPPKYDGCSCTLVVRLIRPKSTETRTSNRLKNASLNPEYSEVFTFADFTFEILEQCELVFEVQARRSGHLLNKTIGELRIPMSQINLQADTPTTALEPLSLKKKDAPLTPNLGRRASDPKWGEIQVLAQYQSTGSWQGRVKIVILKGQSTVLCAKGNSEYQVEVVMKRGEETVNVNTTKLVTGPMPVWNTPFIYDVTQEKLSEHWMELKLIRIGWAKKRATLGHAFLGLGTTVTGSEHWKSIIDIPGKEITLWHVISLQD